MAESLYLRLFTDICSHLQEAVPELAWIDQDLGQAQTDLRPALVYPAALVDFGSTDYSELSAPNQWGETSVTIRLLFDCYSSSAAAAPEASRAMALAFYETEHRVVEALHSWSPPEGYCSALIRIGDSGENRNDIGLRIRTISFSTAFEVCQQ